MKNKRFNGTIDRFEGNTAVILAGDDEGTVEISKDLLPAGCKEGDLISFKIEVKDRKTSAEKEKVEKLIKKLTR
jgi:hypothetical protein